MEEKNVLIQFIRRDFRKHEVITFDPALMGEDGKQGAYKHTDLMNDPEPLGVLIALGRDQIGWAYCSYKKFNKKIMLKVARDRAEKGTEIDFPKNKRAREQYDYFVERCKRYYK